MGRVSGFWSLAALVVVCVALADLIAHPSGTSTLTSAGVKAETTALDAELGKTS
jgi:hypothetical protein